MTSQLTPQDSMDMPGPPQYPNLIVDSNMEALLKTTTELQLELQQTSLELASILLEKGKRGLSLRILANFSEVHCSSTHNWAVVLSMACRLESTIWLGYCGGPGMSTLSGFFYQNLPINYSVRIHQIISNLF